MNYYEHHLGDYDGATAHLSWLEDCAYRRLMCVYYRNEAPVPPDFKQACRLVRATSKAERDAVQQVLDEFFVLQADGWHQKRADDEIQKLGGRVEKGRRAADARWSGKQREKPPPSMLQASPKHDPEHVPKPPNGTCSDDASTDAQGMPNGMLGPCSAHALQSPDSNHQTPIESPLRVLSSGAHAGEACKAMKAAGLQDVNPSHPTLRHLLEQGMTVTELAEAAGAAVQRGKGFAWALTRAIGQREDAAKVALAPPAPKKVSPFALPPGHVRVLDLPDLNMPDEEDESEARDDAAKARG